MEFSFNLNAGDTTNLAAAVVTITLFYITIFRLRQRRIFSMLQPPIPPGPSGLPLVGNLPFQSRSPLLLHPPRRQVWPHLPPPSWLETRHHHLLPSTCPQGPPRPNLAFANHDVTGAARVSFDGGADILWSPQGPTCRKLRRVCVRELLCPTSLAAVSHLRPRQLRSSVRHIYGCAVAGNPINIGDQMFTAVLNVVTSMLWGGTVEGKNSGSDDLQVGRQFRELIGEIALLVGKPNLSDFFPGLERFDQQGIVRKSGVLKERLDEIYDKIIESKRKGSLVEEEKAGEDFLDYMLAGGEGT